MDTFFPHHSNDKSSPKHFDFNEPENISNISNFNESCHLNKIG